MNKKNYSLFNRLVLLFLVIMIFLIVIISIYSFNITKTIEKEGENQNLLYTQLAVMYIGSYQETVKNSSMIDYNQLFNIIRANKKILYAVLVSRDSENIYSYTNSNDYVNNANNTINANNTNFDYSFGNRTKKESISIEYSKNNDILDVVTPIYISGVARQYLKIGFSMTDMKKQVNTMLLFLVLSIVIILVITSYMLYNLSSTLKEPLAELMKGTEKISLFDFNYRINITANNELAELAESFNSMTELLQKSKAALEEYNKNLENKVSERTSELENRDKQLLDINRKLEEANAHMDEANRKLKALDVQKDEFISVAAHELKTPLTSIKGFTQVLNDKTIFSDTEKSSHYLDLISKNTERLYDLVVDLVDSSRISMGKLKLNIDTIDVYDLFNDIKENTSFSIQSKGLSAEFNIAENLPKITGDYERTMQVLRNFISNSTKFTTQGMILLHVYCEGDYVRFDVKDTGQGIPDENKASIFSRFYQVDSTMTRKVGGSGLGLSICKGLVEGMGGKIGFESELGKGSTFYFKLPVVAESRIKT